AGFTLDLVGEATASEAEAARMLARYERLVVDLTSAAGRWPDDPRIDRDDRGPVPRVDVSVKLSSLYARFDPLDQETERIVGKRLRRLLREAARAGAAITVDMEQRAFKDSTLAIVRSALEDDDLRPAPSVTIALQAYLPETDRDLEALVDWAARRRRRVGVRLVKGAYWDSE